MSGNRLVVIGASDLGCRMALAAKAAGAEVVLVDEHPQALKNMSFDAPYFYGSGLPAGLSDETAVFDNVLGSNELLLECVENEIDVKIGVIAWGEFHNAPNSIHIGEPKVGLVSNEGNELLAYDHLVLATGSRDFVPSFKGWDLPGVMGGKAAVKLLTAYQCFNGTRALVLGTTALAVEFARAAIDRGVEIAGFVEPTEELQCSTEDAAWIAEAGLEVFYRSVISAATGNDGVSAATVVAIDGGGETPLKCDCVCVALGILPNVELPAAMGCSMAFVKSVPAWMPRVSPHLETSVENVFWLSSFNGGSEQVDAILERLGGETANADLSCPESLSQVDYLNLWIDQLHKNGGEDVVLCQCESVTRGDFLEVKPPRYLGSELRKPHTPLLHSGNDTRINQDQLKRLTRVGMGHCQGKRCRDEAVLLLAQRFGVPLESIKPATYRFPVRPIDLTLIATEDDDYHTRDKWPHWLHPEEPAEVK